MTTAKSYMKSYHLGWEIVSEAKNEIQGLAL